MIVEGMNECKVEEKINIEYRTRNNELRSKKRKNNGKC